MISAARIRRFLRKSRAEQLRAVRATLRHRSGAASGEHIRCSIKISGSAATAELDGRKATLSHRGSGADRGAILQCFEQLQYEIPELRPRYRSHAQAFYDAILAAGRIPLIVDGGANIGASVLWFSLRYPRAHIVAIEPARDNFLYLGRNARSCDADLRAAAIGAVDGVTLLSDPGEGEWGYRTGAPSGGGYEVPVVSIETILADKPATRYEPFLLKLDIEGAERSLFAGDLTSMARFPVIAIEPHDWLFPGERTASGFFSFHGEAGRDFAFRAENVFSIDYPRIASPGTGAP